MKKSYIKPIAAIHKIKVETMLQQLSDAQGRNAAHDTDTKSTYGASLNDFGIDNGQTGLGGISMSARDRATVDWDF